jgi:hypothetical protein
MDYRHMFITISDTEVEASEFTRAGHTCLGAMGYSFAAGTTDGERYMLLLMVLQLQRHATVRGICFACRRESNRLPPFMQTSTGW